MRIEVFVDEKADDLSVSITCKQLTPQIEKLLAALRMMDHQLAAKKNGETYLLDLAQVLYIEAVDRKCFIYTAREVYESELRLYELEDGLRELDFLRADQVHPS